MNKLINFINKLSNKQICLCAIKLIYIYLFCTNTPFCNKINFYSVTKQAYFYEIRIYNFKEIHISLFLRNTYFFVVTKYVFLNFVGVYTKY